MVTLLSAPMVIDSPPKLGGVRGGLNNQLFELSLKHHILASSERTVRTVSLSQMSRRVLASLAPPLTKRNLRGSNFTDLRAVNYFPLLSSWTSQAAKPSEEGQGVV